MLKDYSVYLPTVQGEIGIEWEDIRKRLLAFSSAGNRLLKLNVFVILSDYGTLIEFRNFIRQSVSDTFGTACPAISVTGQPPENPWKVAVEAVSVKNDIQNITTRYSDWGPYVVISTDYGKEVWGAGLSVDKWPDNTRRSASGAFEMIHAILEKENMSMNNIVRQWNYIGNILQIRSGFQNYQTFNEVRNEYYQKYRTIPGFPAATGIGMMHGGVILDFLAIEAGKSLKLKPVENPNQVNAYEYDQKVLRGLKTKGQLLKHAPQFERALMVINSKAQQIFISGTAAIIGQKTIGKGDIKEQTLVTIENIKKLTDVDRISQIAGNDFATGGKFSLIRVYIKSGEDFEAVKNICREHYPNVPALYVEADICREDLLVEIEGEFLP
jgi:enamine deaminase RidA (YjgF/YER057c/UK114 family)